MDYFTARHKMLATHAASCRASDEDKDRARRAEASLGNQTDADRAWIFNAFLNLIARGAAPTESNILEESRALHRANEAFFASRRKTEAAA